MIPQLFPPDQKQREPIPGWDRLSLPGWEEQKRVE